MKNFMCLPSPSAPQESSKPVEASREVALAEYTPGPWVHSYFGYQVLTGDSWNTICVLHEPGKDHRLASWEDGRGAVTVEANARLIAAAPEMLEAIKAIREWLLQGEPVDEDGNWNKQFARANNLTEAVIAKAEGSSVSDEHPKGEDAVAAESERCQRGGEAETPIKSPPHG